jgi:general secretion pathway protein C
MNPLPVDRSLLTRTSLMIATVALLTAVVTVEFAPSLPRAAPREPRFADAAILCGTRHCIVDRTRLGMILDDPSKLATSMRIVPHVGNGHMYGFRLYAIRAGSLPARLLLRNGDELMAINGMDLSTPDKAIRSFHALRKARAVSLDIVRHGRPLTLSYAIR